VFFTRPDDIDAGKNFNYFFRLMADTARPPPRAAQARRAGMRDEHIECWMHPISCIVCHASCILQPASLANAENGKLQTSTKNYRYGAESA
jgi:hypothetical protein